MIRMSKKKQENKIAIIFFMFVFLLTVGVAIAERNRVIGALGIIGLIVSVVLFAYNEEV